MKLYDTDTHEIFEATAEEFEAAMDNYKFRLHRDLWIYGCAPSIFMLEGPVLKGHRNFIHKLDEEYVMIKFEDKFVHFRWSNELKGKQCFAADDMEDLQLDFDQGKFTRRTIVKQGSKAYPFETDVSCYRFVYYDPNYDCKIAFNEGKTIQFKDIAGEWHNCSVTPCWTDGTEYRIKPEEPKSRLMTYRMLAEWLAKGNGQQSSTECSVRYTFQEVVKEDENKEVPDTFKIRRWGSGEWIEPTINIYMEDCKK